MVAEKPSFETMPTLLMQVQENQKKLAQQLSDFQKSFEQNSRPTQKEILTIEETCTLLGVNRSTLYKWEKEGVVLSYGLEKRRYYKYSEIMERIVPLNK